MFVTVLSVVYNGARLVVWLMGLLHAVLPWWLEAAGALVAVYYGTRLRQAAPEDVAAVFGEPRCIAHRGAGLDAPENTIAAFKYCAENGCNFVELDVRSCADGNIVVLHDGDAGRLTGASGAAVAGASWETLSQLDVAATHPNRDKFGRTSLCRMDEALDFITERDMKVIIDVKGEDKNVISGVVQAFASRPDLYTRAAVTVFNPLVLYQIRRRDERIVGAVSYRPHCLSHASYSAECGPTQPRFAPGSVTQTALCAADVLYSVLWRTTARWSRVSAVLLHKDIVSLREVAYWSSRGVRTIGWSVNRPLEKLYWRGVLGSAYLSDTLVGEPAQASKSTSTESVTLSNSTAKDFRHLNGTKPTNDVLQEKKM